VVPPYTVNYIKRLVGRPGESLFILDGDVYVGAADAELKDYRVQAKPRPAQEALWRVVYDNDFQPSRPDWHEPWAEAAPGSGWKAGAPGHPDSGVMPARVLRFENANGAGVLQFQPEANAGNQPLTDWLAYAATKFAGSGDSYDSRGLVARNNVSDLKLSLFYERHAGDGPLRLQLSKLEQTFTAEFTPGRVRRLRERDGAGGAEELASADLPAGPPHPLHVEFMNVDYRVTVRVDGRDLIQTTPQQYRPDMAFLMQAWERDQMLPKPRVAIGAERQTCDLAHVSLWRDVYYTNRDESSSGPRWGIPGRPINLGPDEYWVLGDNSLMSGDGRYWGLPVELPDEGLHAQPGVVPGRFLLGKAFFVYWPAGYRLSPGSPGMVPNFGDMRFIH
jgi:signal peptidase I